MNEKTVEQLAEEQYMSEAYSQLEDQGQHPYDIGFQLGYNASREELSRLSGENEKLTRKGERLQSDHDRVRESNIHYSNDAFFYKDRIHQLEQENAALKEAQRWVPASEPPNVPKIGVMDLLCKLDTGEKMVLSYVRHEFNPGKFYMDYQKHFDDYTQIVVAYMYLPQ